MHINDKAPAGLWLPAEQRYNEMKFHRCGTSGLKLPELSLGLWHNFGGIDHFENGRRIVRRAFDLGITHFDLANNYGPPYGSAEENFGLMLKKDLAPYRDELIISSKAGYDMWPGPYGLGGSRKYLVSSLDQSLKRMGLDYVDIFYHHCPDPETPVEESMMALDQIVRQGKALYVGISSYSASQTIEAAEILNALGTPCLIHQPRYNMLDRWVEDGLLNVLNDQGVGCIAFSPLAQGILTDSYLNNIPEDSRAANATGHLQVERVQQMLPVIRQLNELATDYHQTLSQLAINWLLSNPTVSSVLIGASSVAQLENNVAALQCPRLSEEQMTAIRQVIEQSNPDQ